MRVVSSRRRWNRRCVFWPGFGALPRMCVVVGRRRAVAHARASQRALPRTSIPADAHEPQALLPPRGGPCAVSPAPPGATSRPPSPPSLVSSTWTFVSTSDTFSRCLARTTMQEMKRCASSVTSSCSRYAYQRNRDLLAACSPSCSSWLAPATRLSFSLLRARTLTNAVSLCFSVFCIVSFPLSGMLVPHVRPKSSRTQHRAAAQVRTLTHCFCVSRQSYFRANRAHRPHKAPKGHRAQSSPHALGSAAFAASLRCWVVRARRATRRSQSHGVPRLTRWLRLMCACGQREHKATRRRATYSSFSHKDRPRARAMHSAVDTMYMY